MNIALIIRMALRAIGHHKGRSLLTVLGIVIGIAGIIATTAIGSGAQKKARDQILSYGERSIDVWSGNWAAHNKIKPDVPLTIQDTDIIALQCKKLSISHHYFVHIILLSFKEINLKQILQVCVRAASPLMMKK
jgi:ABC-type antimicrobial peptide transport system permease subunit